MVIEYGAAVDNSERGNFVASVLLRAAAVEAEVEPPRSWVAEAAELASSLMIEAGVEPQVLFDQGSPVAVVGIIRGREPGSSLGIAASVVEEAESATDAGWGAIAALMLVGTALRDSPASRGDVHLHLGLSRSGSLPGSATAAILANGHRVDAVMAIGASVGQGPQWTATVPGVLSGLIEVDGKVTHCGNRSASIRPGGTGDSVGVNALDKALIVIDAVRRLEEQWLLFASHPQLPPASFTIGITSLSADAGFPVPFYFPDSARIGLRVDYSPARQAESVSAEIEHHVRSFAVLDPWLSSHPPRFTWSTVSPPLDLAPDEPLIACLETASSRVDRREAGFDPAARAFGRSEAPFYAEVGVSAVVVGGGSKMMSGEPSYHDAIDESLVLAELLTGAVNSWFGGDHAN